MVSGHYAPAAPQRQGLLAWNKAAGGRGSGLGEVPASPNRYRDPFRGDGGCVVYAPRHWRGSLAFGDEGLRGARGGIASGPSGFGGTTPFWFLVQRAKSGVITPPSMPHGIAMAFVDGLSDDALISSPQWVGGGLVPAGALKVAHHNWNSKTWNHKVRHQWGNKIALSGLNIRTKISLLSAEASGPSWGWAAHSPSWHVREHSRTEDWVLDPGKEKALQASSSVRARPAAERGEDVYGDGDEHGDEFDELADHAATLPRGFQRITAGKN